MTRCLARHGRARFGMVWLGAARRGWHTQVMSTKPATKCELAIYHRPKPLRFVWHHVLPLACGGKPTPDNMIQVCDNCHYAVHRVMWQLAHGGIVTPGSRKQEATARLGYNQAVAVGAQALIPREGLWSYGAR